MKEGIEDIFSYAIALEQSGRQKNMVFCFEDVVFTMNADKTMLLRFKLPNKEFKQSVGFFASDYDSSDFSVVEDGVIVFTKKGDEFERKKRCRIPDQNFKDVEGLYNKLLLDENRSIITLFQASIVFYKASLDLFEESLSHIEFLSKDKKLSILQRDIFTGAVIELTRKKPEGLELQLSEDEIKQDFGPLGMRTGDLFTLFAFNKRVKINFLPPEKGYFLVEGDHYGMTGIVAGCLYDDIGQLFKVG